MEVFAAGGWACLAHRLAAQLLVAEFVVRAPSGDWFLWRQAFTIVVPGSQQGARCVNSSSQTGRVPAAPLAVGHTYFNNCSEGPRHLREGAARYVNAACVQSGTGARSVHRLRPGPVR